jgi:hypothetical protein
VIGWTFQVDRGDFVPGSPSVIKNADDCSGVFRGQSSAAQELAPGGLVDHREFARVAIPNDPQAGVLNRRIGRQGRRRDGGRPSNPQK